MPQSSLRRVILIKQMADAATEVNTSTGIPTADQGFQMAASYGRLREQARALAEEAGWVTEDDFDRELPPLPEGLANNYHEGSRAGVQARVLLRQLAAWAADGMNVPVDSTFPVRDVAKALARLKKGGMKGRVVITVEDGF